MIQKLSLFFAMISFFFVANVHALSHPKPLTIENVNMSNEWPSSGGKNFSMDIYFTANQNLKGWKFGFYMPFTFKKVGHWNPNLTLEICKVKKALKGSAKTVSNCGPLNYDEHSGADTSAGWTTVFSVDTKSNYQTLFKKQHYVIRAHHNSLGVVRNYSSFPQSFFVILKNGAIINLAPTKPNTYLVADYDQNKIDEENRDHISTNWNKSATLSNDISTQMTSTLIPAPVTQVFADGEYQMQNGIAIQSFLTPKDSYIVNIFKNSLLADIKISATVYNNETSNGQTIPNGIIIHEIADENKHLINGNPEGYQIKITSQAITIDVMNAAGAFYALQTLRQLWNQSLTLKNMTIIDYPRFKYRGIGLDTARHFRTVKQIKSLIDIMAFHKLNTLHIHFADDEGFRLGQLTDYPELKNVGDKRGYGKKLGDNPIAAQVFKQATLDVISKASHPNLYAKATDYYTGSYSKKDITTLIQYANARQITIIPEIDIPGHARTLVKSLPSAFVDPNDKSVFASVQGFSDNVIPICTYHTNISVGPEFTKTIDEIILKIAQAFNNQTTLYALNNEISIGGDETSGDAWTNDSSCEGYWKTLTALSKAQYFFEQLSSANPTLKLSGWQQFVQNDDPSLGTDRVPAEKVGHVWIWNSAAPGIEQAKNLANYGYPTVLSFSDENYFDLTYNKDKTELGQYWATDYADTYAALSSALSATKAIQGTEKPQNILGLEGNLWSENLVTSDDLMYMAMPKMSGLAEAAWSSVTMDSTNSRVHWQSLAQRLGCGESGFLFDLYNLFDVKYRGYPHGISKEVPSNSICPTRILD